MEGHRQEGAYLTSSPVKVDMTLMKRGQTRYNIYCAPCHDKGGNGRGNVAKHSHGLMNPTNFHLSGGTCTMPATAQAEKGKLLGSAAAAAPTDHPRLMQRLNLLKVLTEPLWPNRLSQA